MCALKPWNALLGGIFQVYYDAFVLEFFTFIIITYYVYVNTLCLQFNKDLKSWMLNVN